MTDWILTDLDEFLEHKEINDAAEQADLAQTKCEVAEYLNTVVIPAFEQLKAPLEKHGRKVDIFGTPGTDSVSIQVNYKEKRELDYSVKIQFQPRHARPHVITKTREAGQYYRSESPVKNGWDDSILNVTQEDIMKNFLDHYKNQAEPSKG
jgi:hypothetical protein